MEQARLLLAIGLSCIVFLVWSIFFVERPPETVSPAEPILTEMEVEKQKPGDEIRDFVESVSTPSSITQSVSQQVEEKRITVETPYYVATLSTDNATFHGFMLNHYKENTGPDASKKELITEDFKKEAIQFALIQNSIPGFDMASYSVDLEKDRLIVGEEKKQVSFEWTSDKGVSIKKTFGFNPASYLIDYNITIENNSDVPIHDTLVLAIQKPVKEDKGYSFTGPVALINNALEQIKIKKIKDRNEYPGSIQWIAYDDGYFIYSIIPEASVDSVMKLSITNDTLVNQLVNPEFQIPPGSRKEFKFYIFMGPKSMDVLKNMGHNLDKALNFGFFNFIAKPCLWFMNKIYNVIPNYGIAIIVLTIFTKIILWPLGNKSYKSMNDMKKLQPLMLDIREKYKNDKQKMNQEVMSLYRTYKINPMGGCLPMILQIPVFFALYRMLYQAIELRHAPFLLWINDLSAPDRLFDFGFSIPFMEPPYGIPVLTLIMGGTMLLQQKMAPPPGDPAQAKMMMLMPIIFTFIFINFSSGLVLYWLVNNILSIGQQYYIQQKSK